MKIGVDQFSYQATKIKQYTISNSHGVVVKLLDWGATIKEISTPDSHGQLENITLSYLDDADYVANKAYFGSTLGPLAGRVANARLIINDVLYQLEANDGRHTLHGASSGLSHQTWQSQVIEGQEAIVVLFSYHKAHGEGGHPANIDITVKYTLSEANQLAIEYHAVADRPTVLNLSNHVYFNLSGNNKRDLSSHTLLLGATCYYPNNDEHIIDGQKLAVKNTAYDFCRPALLNSMLKYNNYYPFERAEAEDTTSLLLSEAQSGRSVVISTNQTGVVLYSSGYANGCQLAPRGQYRKFSGLALELQNQPIGYDNLFLAKSLLKAGEVYCKKTEFTFMADGV